MKKKSEPSDFFYRIWKLFASLRLTIIVLLSLAATSIIGTVIPQNESPAAYFRTFGEVFYRLFTLLDIFDMYHSWWFQFLLLLLTINILVCSLERLSATWKIIFARPPRFNLSRFQGLANKKEFSADRSPEALQEIYAPLIAANYRYTRIEPTKSGFCIFAEKWRWTRLGAYTVHLSVILLLLGGSIGSIFGLEGFANIPEGEAVNSIQLRNTGTRHDLGFEIRCDKFSVSFYDTGAPREYRSSLAILVAGTSVVEKDIIVNDPLRYEGFNIFQSSYGSLPSEKVTLNFTSRESGMVYSETVTVGQKIAIPEGRGTFVLKDYKNAANFRGHNLGAAFSGILTPKDAAAVEVILPLRFPSFDKMRKGELVISVSEHTPRYYTGLQVTKDPGVWVVYAGFVIMIVGCFITFFMSHQQLCVEVRKRGSRSRVMVAGLANKNRLGMEKKVHNLTEALSRLEAQELA